MRLQSALTQLLLESEDITAKVHKVELPELSIQRQKSALTIDKRDKPIMRAISKSPIRVNEP